MTNPQLTVPELAQLVDSGTPVTQAQVRAALRSKPQVFWPEEERWDLAIFHRFAEQQHLFRGRRGQNFDQDRYFRIVLAESIRLKGHPINLVTLVEKYLIKISKSLGITRQHFPTDRLGILRRLEEFTTGNPDFHKLRQNNDSFLWSASEWPKQVEIAPPAYLLPADFLERAFVLLEKRHQPTRLLSILQGVLGIDANHPDFSAAFAQANSVLTGDSESFVQVQEQAWMLVHYLPQAIEEIPARIAIPRWRNSNEETLVDALYAEWPIEGLGEASEFVDEEAPAPAGAGFDDNCFDELRFVLPYRWRQNGVLKVNARERRIFPDRPARIYLQFQDQFGGAFPVWLNNDTGYLYGLQDWYAAYLVPAGGVFYLQRSPGSKYDFKVHIRESQAHTFDGKQYFCEVDPDTYIEEARLSDLEALRIKVDAAQATVKDAVCDVFESSSAEAEMHYKQVWAQVHVVRPTTRRTVASILSAFPCFYQVEPGSGLWRYAPSLRNAPPKRYQAKRPAISTPKPTVKPPVRPVRYWLVPVRESSWETLARRAEASAEVFLVPWRGRSRVVRGDRLVFFDGKNEVILAAAETLREPVQDDATGRREVAVRPLLSGSTTVAYADVAGNLSVPKPDPDDFPVEITLEDMEALLKHLRLSATARATEQTSDVLPEQKLPEAQLAVASSDTTIATFIARNGRPYDPREPYEHTAFASPVKAGKNTGIYNVHSYHTKVPPQGIEPYIEHYTNPGDIVLDPFCGSGMTGIAALKTARKAILSDLSPAAVHIARNYCTSLDVPSMRRELKRVWATVKSEFDWLYGTTCDRCNGPATIHYIVWSDVFECGQCGGDLILWETAVDHSDGQVQTKFSCPHCGKKQSKLGLSRLPETPVLTFYDCSRCRPSRGQHATSAKEKELIAEISATPIPYWTPDTEFDTNGPQYRRNALSSRHIIKVTDLFTKRNLYALASLWNQARNVSDERIRDILQFGLTSVSTRLVSRLTGYQFGRRGNVPVSGTIYIPSFSVERNVWGAFKSKTDTIMKEWPKLPSGHVHCRVWSATNLPLELTESVDYIFTDPPFGSSIYYSELNLLWEAWLQEFSDVELDAVVHRKQDGGTKRLPDYARLLEKAFVEMHRVLKPGRWASVVFHNSDDQVWQAIQQGAEAAGFDLVNAMVFDKKQRSFKGIRGEKGLEKVTNFDIVLNLHKRAELQPMVVPGDQARIEEAVVAAVEEHLRSGPAPDYRTGQYLHSLAIRALINAKISVELPWPALDSLLERHFRHINCHWYLPKEAVSPSGHGFLVRKESAAVAWLEHILAASPQTESDLIPQWQIATLGAGSSIKRTLPELLSDYFWHEETSGLWCVPTAAQQEILKQRRGRVRPQQLSLGL